MQSMTGFGVGRRSHAGADWVAEIRSVNGRFLKVAIRAPQTLAARELDLENRIKESLRRGTVSVTLRVRYGDPARLVAINEDVVRAYQAAFDRLGLPRDAIPTLPGVFGERGEEGVADAEWAAVTGALDEAIASLGAMRAREGQALAALLGASCKRVDELRLRVRARAPSVVQEWRGKLEQRLERLLGDQTPSDPQTIAREVAIHADRSDVTEEVDRLGAHVAEMQKLLAQQGEVGRTLEFLAQEMLREANTIGSKSADAELSSAVVQLKSEIERIKEQVANVE